MPLMAHRPLINGYQCAFQAEVAPCGAQRTTTVI